MEFIASNMWISEQQLDIQLDGLTQAYYRQCIITIINHYATLCYYFLYQVQQLSKVNDSLKYALGSIGERFAIQQEQLIGDVIFEADQRCDKWLCPMALNLCRTPFCSVQCIDSLLSYQILLGLNNLHQHTFLTKFLIQSLKRNNNLLRAKQHLYGSPSTAPSLIINLMPIGKVNEIMIHLEYLASHQIYLLVSYYLIALCLCQWFNYLYLSIIIHLNYQYIIQQLKQLNTIQFVVQIFLSICQLL